jgi:hypothetical protein
MIDEVVHLFDNRCSKFIPIETFCDRFETIYYNFLCILYIFFQLMESNSIPRVKRSKSRIVPCFPDWTPVCDSSREVSAEFRKYLANWISVVDFVLTFVVAWTCSPETWDSGLLDLLSVAMNWCGLGRSDGMQTRTTGFSGVLSWRICRPLGHSEECCLAYLSAVLAVRIDTNSKSGLNFSLKHWSSCFNTVCRKLFASASGIIVCSCYPRNMKQNLCRFSCIRSDWLTDW